MLIFKFLILLAVVFVGLFISAFSGNKIYDTCDKVVKVYTEEEKKEEQEEIDKNE